jgi:hypothetical protein
VSTSPVESRSASRPASSTAARRFAVRWVVPVARFVSSFFFDSKYLRGRHFEVGLGGWKWVWRSFWTQCLLGVNRHVPWPVNPLITITDPDRIEFDPDDMNNFQMPGTYFQTIDADIRIGKGTYIAQNVGLITSNHDPADPSHRVPGEPIVLGRCCWIGMNAVLLPGVVLGDHTVVGAGAVVTKSFPEGHCTIAGNPAVVVRRRPQVAVPEGRAA